MKGPDAWQPITAATCWAWFHGCHQNISKQMQPSTCIFHAKEVADSIEPFQFWICERHFTCKITWHDLLYHCSSLKFVPKLGGTHPKKNFDFCTSTRRAGRAIMIDKARKHQPSLTWWKMIKSQLQCSWLLGFWLLGYSCSFIHLASKARTRPKFNARNTHRSLDLVKSLAQRLGSKNGFEMPAPTLWPDIGFTVLEIFWFKKSGWCIYVVQFVFLTPRSLTPLSWHANQPLSCRFVVDDLFTSTSPVSGASATEHTEGPFFLCAHLPVGVLAVSHRPGDERGIWLLWPTKKPSSLLLLP